jgi:hypothetical protein
MHQNLDSRATISGRYYPYGAVCFLKHTDLSGKVKDIAMKASAEARPGSTVRAMYVESRAWNSGCSMTARWSRPMLTPAAPPWALHAPWRRSCWIKRLAAGIATPEAKVAGRTDSPSRPES